MRPDDNDDDEDSGITFAEQEFINWCDANGIDHTEEDMEEEDRRDFKKTKKRFMRAVDEKRLVVDGTKIEYTISRFSKKNAGQTLAISRPIGRDFIAMDGFRDTQQMQRFQAFIASIAKTEKSLVANLDIEDRQLLVDIGTLFLVG
ncbi:MAG: hypothetical protein LBK62_02970 [Treponema sp.]|jgi:hypothetical protein|nr:hypothetical protein [Treponema sp.]